MVLPQLVNDRLDKRHHSGIKRLNLTIGIMRHNFLLHFRWRQLLPETLFLRKLLLLASGTVAGQALLVVSSPLLTRFFSPAEFGIFAVFAAVTVIAGILTGLRFEFAVPIVSDDADAAALVNLTVLCTLLTASLALLFLWLAGDWFRVLIGAPTIGAWLWCLPLAMLIWGLGSALSFWSVRRGRFAINGIAFTLQFGSQAGGQLTLGFLGAGAPGLLIGYVLGYLGRTGFHALRVPQTEWQLFRAQGPARIWRNAQANWHYPAMALPSQLLESISQMVPVILVASLFGPATAGWYALSQRIMGLPVRVLSEAASQVFLGELRHLDDTGLHRFFLRTVLLFIGLGLLGMVPVLLFAPPAFAFVFGDSWREAGAIVQLLVPLYLMRFVVIPISQLLYYLKRQNVVLLASIFGTTAMLGSFGVGHFLHLDAPTTILVFSCASSIIHVFYLFVTWRLAKNARH